MNKNTIISIFGALMAFTPSAAEGHGTLKDVLGKYFTIGAAVTDDIVWGRSPEEARIVTENFNSIVAENSMKGENIHPYEDTFYWVDADRTVKFAEDHKLEMIGHCLVWHSQPPKWMFTYEKGDTVPRHVLIDRMYHHITTIVKRYKGRIKGWDVVNEAVNDDGTMRETPYYKIIGPDYIELAFRFAHEADPDAELYINDYSTAKPQKRATICKIVRQLKANGCRVDGIGMQSHNGTDYPDLKEYEASIDSFAACGVKVMMTELDLNMLPTPKDFSGAEISQNFKYEEKYNPYKNGLDKEGEKLFEQRYLDFFKIYYRHRHQISRVTFWGVTDTNSWLNDFPVEGRTNYSLPFDRNNKAKPVVKKIIELFKEQQ